MSEYAGNSAFMKILVLLKSTGAAQEFSKTAVDARQSLVSSMPIRSDDPHVIALALVSGARLLVSADVDLVADFKDRAIVNAPRGKVYNLKSANRLVSRYGR